MKQTLPLLLAVAVFITSCSKSSNPKPSSKPSVLLTKIIDNTAGDPYLGQTLAEFTYNGKQLSKAIIYHYSITPDVETDLFNYDSQGHLTGTAISHTLSNSYNVISSTVTYSGSNISEIKFYRTGNVLDRDVTITYQNGNITNWLNTDEVSDTYTYDSNGHNTKEVAAEYQSGQPDGGLYTTTNAGFDTKSNLTQTQPLWIYFRVYQEDQMFGFAPGSNNPTTVNNGADVTYGYQYNSYGYPSTVTWSGQSYQYEYIQVN